MWSVVVVEKLMGSFGTTDFEEERFLELVSQRFTTRIFTYKSTFLINPCTIKNPFVFLQPR